MEMLHTSIKWCIHLTEDCEEMLIEIWWQAPTTKFQLQQKQKALQLRKKPMTMYQICYRDFLFNGQTKQQKQCQQKPIKDYPFSKDHIDILTDEYTIYKLL